MPPLIDVTRLAAGTRILVETENHIWSLSVINPEEALIEVYGTDPQFKDRRPARGILLQSFEQGEHGINFPHSLVKNCVFQVRFANVVLVGGPIVTARVEGRGWSYEAIE